MTNFFHAFQNSLVVTVCTVVLTLLTNSLVAYVVSRNMDKTFFKALYYYFVSALFVPFPIIMLPIVKETSKLGMNNHTGLSIPGELEEAATMDGASVWGTFWKVIFPLLALLLPPI